MDTNRWFWVVFYMVIMTLISLFMFDELAITLIFGIGVGGIFGWVFSSKKRE